MKITAKLLKDRRFEEVEYYSTIYHQKEIKDDLFVEIFSEVLYLKDGEGEKISLGKFNTIERLDQLIEVLTAQD